MARFLTLTALAASLCLPLAAEAAPRGCPPGLAKKSADCTPPGLAKKGHGDRDAKHRHDHDRDRDDHHTHHYDRGDRIRDGYVVIRDPRRYQLDPGQTYYRVGESVYRVDRETGQVLDLMGAIAGALN